MRTLNHTFQSAIKASNNMTLRTIAAVMSVMVFASNALANDLIVERRKDQFPTSPGRLIAPVPYSLPGIGDGFFLLGHFANVFSSTADVTVLKATGDIHGYDANIDEIPIIDRHLFMRAELMDLSSIQQNYYDTRGMNTDKNDYSLIDISSFKQRNLGLDLTFYERRLTFSLERSISKGELSAVRNSDGDIVTEFSEPYKFDNYETKLTMQLDLTDDYQDPRSGVRANLRYQDHPAKKDNDPDYYVTELDVSLYKSLFKTDTLVFNLFQSDAHVTKKGNINRDDIAAELGFNCAPTDTQCQDTETSVVNNFVNERAHGTATPLGGLNRLRGFPGERFNGAHSATVGMEYRMNFEHESTPFNYSIWKDTQTGIQVAFFAEIGTVAETMDDLWKQTRSVVGSGVRLVTGSGAVYRFDLAVGDEGVQPNLFFYYPWK